MITSGLCTCNWDINEPSPAVTRCFAGRRSVSYTLITSPSGTSLCVTLNVSVYLTRALIAPGSVQRSLYVKGGEGRYSATHCMTSNGEEQKCSRSEREVVLSSMQLCSFSHIVLTRDCTNKTGSEICTYEKFKVVAICSIRFNTKRFYLLYTKWMYVFCMVFSTKSGFFLRIRSESGPGSRNRIVFRLWSGRPWTEFPHGRQGPVADHSQKFGVGVKNEWSYNSPYTPSWSVLGSVVLFTLLTEWIL